MYTQKTARSPLQLNSSKVVIDVVVQTATSPLQKNFPLKRTTSDDDQFVKKIVEDIWQKLEHIYPRSDPEGLVGIDKNLEKIELLFEEFQTIGFWGMGGIGKTTIARILFDRYSYRYEGHCFLEDVRENSKRLGLPSLRERLLSRLLKKETYIAESDLLKRRLSRMRVFIVFDDVDTPQQIEFLVQDINCFRSDSKIIITARNKQVLDGRVDKIHKIEGLDYQESVQLFYLNAFDKGRPQTGFEELSRRAVNYAKGLPLALKLLGSFLRSNSQSEERWKSALKRLERYPYMPIDNVLRWSYDGLEHEEKEIFLDIAFFFKGERQEDVKNFLNACNFSATIGLSALKDKALVNISADGTIEMHDLIQEMGWQIVREKDPERRSRLSNHIEIYDILKNNKGSDIIEGIILNLFEMPDICFNDDAFKKMTRLRFLKFYCRSENTFKMIIDVSDGIRFCQIVELDVQCSRVESGCYKLVNLQNSRRVESFNVQLIDNIEEYYMERADFPQALKLELIDISNSQYLHHVPAIYCAKNFVHFIMCDRSIKKLWGGVQNLVSLKKIDLHGCRNLIELPDLSMALNLESIDLSYCKSLHHVPTNSIPRNLVHFIMRGSPINKLWDGVLNLVSLKEIDLKECHNLVELPDLSEALNLESIDLSYCTSLHHVTTNFCFEKLVHFVMRGSHLKKLWDEVQNFVSLEEIDLTGSMELIEVPDLSRASKLRRVELSNCANLCHLHPSILSLQSLYSLNLFGCNNLESLQSGIPLDNLSFLNLNRCTRLKDLSLSSAIIKEVDLGDTAIETLDPSIGRCSNLQSLVLRRSQIKSLPNELSGLQSLRKLNLSYSRELDTRNLHIILSGLFSLRYLCLQECNVESLPACIKYLSFLEYIDISNCKRLRSILGLPLSLISLNANACTSLETINTPMTSTLLDVGTSFLWNGLSISLQNCVQLDANSICAIERNAHKRLMVAAACQCDHSIQLCFPGKGVPNWFRHHEMRSLITIELPPDFNPLGFAFSVVLSDVICFSNIRIECICYLEDGEIVTSGSRNYYWWNDDVPREWISSHVILWYNETLSEAIMKTIREGRAKCTSYNPKLSFQFSMWDGKHEAIKECGVWPIHASEIEYSVEEMEDWLELGRTLDCPTKKLKPSFLTKRLELELGTKSYSTSGIAVGSYDAKDLTKTNFNCLLDYQFSVSDIEEYEVCSVTASESQNSIDQLELTSNADEERQLPLTQNFKESTFQPIPMGLELETNSESKTYLDNDEIEAGSSNQVVLVEQKPLLQIEDSIFQPHTTPTGMLNDDKELSKTFSCVCFIGFLWKCISRLISSS